ncbi:MAG: glycosyltransferase family 2 protein [Armatimonas sp.]
MHDAYDTGIKWAVTLSVCIVHWNTTDDLLTCIEALQANLNTRGSQEIIVVDNASTDGAAERVCPLYPQVRWIQNATNRCFAEATNQAVAASTGELVTLLNPDARVTAGALDTLASFLERDDADIVAPKLIWPDGRVQPSVRNHPTPKNVLLGAWTRPAPASDAPQQVAQPMASCLMFPRTVWEKVGPMDERFPLYFNDADWSLRADIEGLNTWYVPAAVVVHDHAGTTSKVKLPALWESRKAWLRFNKKHFPNHPLRPLLTAMITMDAWRRTGRWWEPLGKDGGETTPEDWHRAIISP